MSKRRCAFAGGQATPTWGPRPHRAQRCPPLLLKQHEPVDGSSGIRTMTAALMRRARAASPRVGGACPGGSTNGVARGRAARSLPMASHPRDGLNPHATLPGADAVIQKLPDRRDCRGNDQQPNRNSDPLCRGACNPKASSTRIATLPTENGSADHRYIGSMTCPIADTENEPSVAVACFGRATRAPPDVLRLFSRRCVGGRSGRPS